MEMILPNENALRIVVLFLEKYELLREDEREAIVDCIKILNKPMFVVQNEQSS